MHHLKSFKCNAITICTVHATVFALYVCSKCMCVYVSLFILLIVNRIGITRIILFTEICIRIHILSGSIYTIWKLQIVRIETLCVGSNNSVEYTIQLEIKQCKTKWKNVLITENSKQELMHIDIHTHCKNNNNNKKEKSSMLEN